MFHFVVAVDGRADSWWVGHPGGADWQHSHSHFFLVPRRGRDYYRRQWAAGCLPPQVAAWVEWAALEGSKGWS